jgi:hypothetical protein
MMGVMRYSIMTSSIHDLGLMRTKHVKVAKEQEWVSNDTRRRSMADELLRLSARGCRPGAEMRLYIIVIDLNVDGHVGECAHVLSGS